VRTGVSTWWWSGQAGEREFHQEWKYSMEGHFTGRMQRPQEDRRTSSRVSSLALRFYSAASSGYAFRPLLQPVVLVHDLCNLALVGDPSNCNSASAVVLQ